MNTIHDRPTAQIYEFPTARVRASVARRRNDVRAMEELISRSDLPDFSGGWYHEAAIRETDPTRKH